MPYFEKLRELEPGAENMKTVLGNFQLIKKIASGGMGDLYYGIQLSLRRPVAVKQLHPDLASDPKYIERFEREAVLLGAMSNENIVGVIEFGRESGFYYIVLEYVDGVSLAGLVKKVGPLPSNVALTIIEGAARGLAYAHKKGVVHRDINPANIMLSRDGIIKITDFGLAKPVGFSGDSGGLIVGTPGYMSPEQARGEEVDSRSDIFSLGLVFYELLAGKPAVEGTFPELFEKIKEPAEIPLDRLPPQTDRRLTEIIRKMIAKDKYARYQDISEALADIRRLRRDAPEFSSPAKLDEFLTEWEIVPPAPEESDVVEKITHIETIKPKSAGKVPET
ncbi:MAG TPA: serine/threonine protein kinase, partial [candidate division Zixibacteria bacterium]|nr:serine/threonine protein kinase [candidate division Zixibacteria bacterium]